MIELLTFVGICRRHRGFTDGGFWKCYLAHLVISFEGPRTIIPQGSSAFSPVYLNLLLMMRFAAFVVWCWGTHSQSFHAVVFHRLLYFWPSLLLNAQKCWIRTVQILQLGLNFSKNCFPCCFILNMSWHKHMDTVVQKPSAHSSHVCWAWLAVCLGRSSKAVLPLMSKR